MVYPHLQEALHVCEIHLDDLEEWLAVFGIKLSNMRQDIHAIEVRLFLIGKLQQKLFLNNYG